MSDVKDKCGWRWMPLAMWYRTSCGERIDDEEHEFGKFNIPDRCPKCNKQTFINPDLPIARVLHLEVTK